MQIIGGGGGHGPPCPPIPMALGSEIMPCNKVNWFTDFRETL